MLQLQHLVLALLRSANLWLCDVALNGITDISCPTPLAITTIVSPGLPVTLFMSIVPLPPQAEKNQIKEKTKKYGVIFEFKVQYLGIS